MTKFTIELTVDQLLILSSVLAYNTPAKDLELVRRNYGDIVADSIEDIGKKSFEVYDIATTQLEKLGFQETEDNGMPTNHDGENYDSAFEELLKVLGLL